MKRDPQLFAEKIVYLIKHPEKVEMFGKEGRKRVIKDFSWEKHNSLLEKYFRSVSKSNVRG